MPLPSHPPEKKGRDRETEPEVERRQKEGPVTYWTAGVIVDKTTATELWKCRAAPIRF